MTNEIFINFLFVQEFFQCRRCFYLQIWCQTGDDNKIELAVPLSCPFYNRRCFIRLRQQLITDIAGSQHGKEADGRIYCSRRWSELYFVLLAITLRITFCRINLLAILVAVFFTSPSSFRIRDKKLMVFNPET